MTDSPPADLFRDQSASSAINAPIQNDVPQAAVERTTSARDGGTPQHSKTGAEIQEEIEEALRDLPPLPQLDGDSTQSRPDLDTLQTPSNESSRVNNPSQQDSRDLSDTNDVDCVAAAAACEDHFAFIRQRERTDMSVDITPLIEPREFDMTKVDQIRQEKLAEVKPRPWRDRQGDVIADGTFEDYRQGSVVVRTVNGTQRKVPLHQLSDEDRCYVHAWWELPEECNFESEPFVMRDFRMSTFTWTAAVACHKPLYFEEVGLERYGHTAGPLVQPIVSGAHFFGNVFMLPYHAGLTPPNECVYPLGYYRPGECAPWIVRGFPVSTRAVRWQALALGAGIALLP